MKNDRKSLELISNIDFGENYEILEVLSDTIVPKCFLVMDNQSGEKKLLKLLKMWMCGSLLLKRKTLY